MPFGGRVPGKIVKIHPQVLKTDTFLTTSTTFVDITGVTITVKPKSARSKFMVIVQLAADGGADGQYPGMFKLQRNGTDIGLGDAAGSRTRATGAVAGVGTLSSFNVAVLVSDAPATTSDVTYKIQARASASGTFTLNRTFDDGDSANVPRVISSLTVVEYID